ncbi:malate synthase-like isoform X1 [Montipora capricornis]|uniref:malate synthase-like isoform X1 n=1 Tax=Montipora capricornis TaxID=246305 RepID=UPI0035F1B30F
MAASKRLSTVSGHLQPISMYRSEKCCRLLLDGLNELGVVDVEVSNPPTCYEMEFQTVLTPKAMKFVAELVKEFNENMDQMLKQRSRRKLHLSSSGELPFFQPQSPEVQDKAWQVSPVPQRLQCRIVDLGDISPANTELFIKALNSSACGIQTDLDDGHCPSWSNQLHGLYNVYQFVHGNMRGVPPMSSAPVIMFRPRAWNMQELNVMVGGSIIPGPLFDFGLHMFHNSKLMMEEMNGPFFYLPKLEGSSEVKLWSDIFIWTEQKLGLPLGSIKACVLIENIFCSFELDQILYELRHHCAGLNCGMWDYSASFVSKFGERKDFILPDRKKYVSMDMKYLKSNMDLVIKTCHARGCHATGGMAPVVLPCDSPQCKQNIIKSVSRSKLREIQAGVDGFLVFDPNLVRPLLQMWKSHVNLPNQLHISRADVCVSRKELLQLPQGGFTLQGLHNNLTVGILFIDAWFRGEGLFVLNGAVEDSATAEISRSQVWQAIRHRCQLEGDGRTVSRELVCEEIQRIASELICKKAKRKEDAERLLSSAQILEELVLKRDFPPFFTTFLYEHYKMRNTTS